MSDLKKCPFCGGEAEARTSEERMYRPFNVVRCQRCHVKQDGFDQAKKQAIAAWNHRPVEDQLRADKAELVEAGEAMMNVDGHEGSECYSAMRLDSARGHFRALIAKHKEEA